MKIKKLKPSQVYQYPHRMNAVYPDCRAVLIDGFYAQFTGEKEKKNFVVYDDLSDYEILKLQLILADPTTVKKMEYSRQLLRMLSIRSKIMLAELANELCVEEQWIKERLKIASDIDTNRVCVTNAYALSKVKNRGPLMGSAQSTHPANFMPICNSLVRDERKAVA